MLRELTWGGDHSAALPLRRARSATGPHSDPRFLEWAAALLVVAAEEEASVRASRAGAVFHRVFSSGDEGAAGWRLYRQRIETSLAHGPISFRQLQSLLEEAPTDASSSFRELSSILREPDRQTFAELALHLARRNLDRNEMPQVSHALLSFASEAPNTEGRAASLLNVLGGGGSFFQQLEFQGPRLLDELVSPLALGPFVLMGLGARGASLAVLGRAGRITGPSLMASEAAAWAVEVPTLVLSRRLGMQLFVSGDAFFHPSEIGQEMLAAAGPFLFLRGASNFFELATPAFRRSLTNASGQINPLGLGAIHATRFSGEVLAMMAGHSFNAATGLGPRLEGWQNFNQSLLGAAHMRLAGHLIHRLGGDGLATSLAAHKSRLWQETLGSLRFPFGDNPFLVRPDLALAGGPEFKDPRELAGLIFMMGGAGSGSGEGGSGRPPPTEVPAPRDPRRFGVLRELIRSPLEDFSSDVARQQTLLGKAAEKLNGLLDRYSERPDLAQDATFARQLAEARAELAEAQKVDSKMQRTWRTLRVLLRDYSEANPVAAESLETQKLEASLEQSQQQMAAEAEQLTRLQRVLQAMGRFGNQDRLQTHLKNATAALNRLYQGALQWSIPGLRRGTKGPDPRDAVYGALLGLAARGDAIESPLMMDLRNEVLPANRELDIELEYLHQAMLLAARSGFAGEGLGDAVSSLADSYRVAPRSHAAMRLSVEMLQNFSRGKSDAATFFATLKDLPAAAPLRDDFRDMRSLLDDGIPLADGLPILGQEFSAADFLISGMFLMFRSEGKPEVLARDLREARELQVAGFHPSIALSFFGAAHGREVLPQEFLIPSEQWEAFFQRALPRDPAE